MQNQALLQLREEIRQFSIICLLNLVFAAIAMAFGISYVVAAVIGQSPDPGIPGLRMLTGAVALVCFGLGISWLLTTVKIFEGVDAIQDRLDAEGTAITDDRITCLIVQMLAHYRDHRETIRRMILVCTFGGICFFGMGIGTSIGALSISPGGLAFTLDNVLVLPAMLLTLGIALVSLLSSYYFSKFANVWERRLREIDESECALRQSLGIEDT